MYVYIMKKGGDTPFFCMKAKVAVSSVVLLHQKKVNRFASFKGKSIF